VKTSQGYMCDDDDCTKVHPNGDPAVGELAPGWSYSVEPGAGVVNEEPLVPTLLCPDDTEFWRAETGGQWPPPSSPVVHRTSMNGTLCGSWHPYTRGDTMTVHDHSVSCGPCLTLMAERTKRLS
jgi:hypothetical protein